MLLSDILIFVLFLLFGIFPVVLEMVSDHEKKSK